MEFSKEYIIESKSSEIPSTIYLPNGEIKINLWKASTEYPVTATCWFTKSKTNCVYLDNISFFILPVCVDILITMKEMGYDFLSIDQLKQAKKEHKEKILTIYHELLLSSPSLFKENASQIKNEEEDLDVPPDMENFSALKHQLSQAVSRKYTTNSVNLKDLSWEIENHFINKKFGYFGNIKPKVSINIAMNGDVAIIASTGALLNTWGNTRNTAICVILSKMETEIWVTCGMIGNYGIFNWKSIIGLIITDGNSAIGNVASRAKDSADIKEVIDYIENLVCHYFENRSANLDYNVITETSITEKLKQLAELKELRIITEEEFDNKKHELLARL